MVSASFIIFMWILLQLADVGFKDLLIVMKIYYPPPCQPRMWPDLAKNSPYYLVFGYIFNLLWQKLMPLGKFSLLQMAKYWWNFHSTFHLNFYQWLFSLSLSISLALLSVLFLFWKKPCWSIFAFLAFSIIRRRRIYTFCWMHNNDEKHYDGKGCVGGCEWERKGLYVRGS